MNFSSLKCAVLALLLVCSALPSAARQQGNESQGQSNHGSERRQEREAQDPRRGKLSPDERRELRRQINEAGHDIYGRPRQ